ncbi:MAG: Hsp20/alpha crystallin family protein [Proteobacteria bacterium]|nr:Hsp20/alpha crystallin family protein [Pseudomonadota bacterium]MBU1737298.1 Hsp20/alpha crystallin family protein [Pseudomonadota bacterium]
MLDLVPFRKSHYLDPFKEVEHLARHFWHDLPFRDITTAGEFDFAPRLDITETDKTLEVKAELPGLERKDVDITLDNDFLVIKGEKKHEEEEKGRHFHRVERHFGSFQRSVRLPVEVDTKKVKATFKDGVLTVTMTKIVTGKEKATHIEIQ